MGYVRIYLKITLVFIKLKLKVNRKILTENGAQINWLQFFVEDAFKMPIKSPNGPQNSKNFAIEFIPS